MHINKNQVIHRGGNKPIVYDVFSQNPNESKPLVVFCHGYKGFKDWGAWDLAAQSFANAGFHFVKFNFSHNGGTIENPIDFPDLEAFAQNNYSKEIQDVNDVISEMTTKTIVSNSSVHLIGHSRGGGIVLLAAQKNSKVNSVITWAGVSDYKSRFMIDSSAFNKWQQTGRMYVENGRTKQQMPHDFQFYKDFEANEEKLTIKNAIKALKKPLLIIHGDDDPTVPVTEANALHQWQPNSALKIIKGANHVFGAKHPWEEKKVPPHLREVLDLTIDFMKQVSKND